MNIVILSRKRSFYSTRRLREEAASIKAKVQIIDPLRCILCLKDKPGIIVSDKQLKNVDVVIPRVGTYAVAYSIAVVR